MHEKDGGSRKSRWNWNILNLQTQHFQLPWLNNANPHISEPTSAPRKSVSVPLTLAYNGKIECYVRMCGFNNKQRDSCRCIETLNSIRQLFIHASLVVLFFHHFYIHYFRNNNSKKIAWIILMIAHQRTCTCLILHKNLLLQQLTSETEGNRHEVK